MTLFHWAYCTCSHRPEHHDAVIIRPICIDPGNRVLFEGTLGACGFCDCEMFQRLSREVPL